MKEKNIKIRKANAGDLKELAAIEAAKEEEFRERLIPYYEKFGYQNQGVSDSAHGGAVWYDMRLTFEANRLG